MDGGRNYVIGDIHGCLEELNVMLDAIAPGGEDHLCFLGDYVDRGPSSCGVVDRLIRLRDEGPRCTFLKGNHEDMFLSYLGHPGAYGDSFLMNGGGRTLVSYGLGTLAGPAAAQRLPPDHEQFLLGLESEARFGDFLCVHAGLRPTLALEEQNHEDRFWIREEFISVPHPFPFTVLFGHTPHREILLDLPYKLGLDTGLVYGNKLSCFETREKTLLQVERGAVEAQRRSLVAEFEQCAELDFSG